MSQIIRKGIIEVELRQKGGLSGGSTGSATGADAYRREAAAISEVTKVTQESTRVVQESTRTNQEFGTKSLSSFREAGEGAFKMARGIALLGANGSADLQRLIKHVALVQGGFDVFAGGLKIFTNLAAVMGGPVSLAITGVTTAVSAGALAWLRYKTNAENAAAAAKESAKKQEDAIKKVLDLQDRMAGARLSLDEEERALKKETLGLLPEDDRRSAFEAESRALAEQLRLAEEAKARSLQFAQTTPGTLVGGEIASEQSIRKAEQLLEEQMNEAVSVARSRLEVEQEIFRLRQDELAAQEQKQLGDLSKNATLGELGKADLDSRREGIEGDFNEKGKRLAEEMDVLFKGLFQVIRDNNTSLGRLKSELDQAAAATP